MSLVRGGGTLALVLAGAVLMSPANGANASAQGPPNPSPDEQRSWMSGIESTGLMLAPAGDAEDVTLTIKTAPALPGVRLTLDGVPMVTDESGVATTSQGRNSQTHTLTLIDTGIDEADTRYTFARWIGQRDPDQAFTATLDGLPMRADSALTAAFTVEHTATLQFVDQGGKPIDPAQVTSATARSDTGALISVSPTQPTWLEGTRVVYHANALDIQNTSYSWQTVMVAGANVVDAGRQSFTPATTASVTVVGQFHDLTVIGFDALFGRGVGDQAVVTFPDGTVQTAPLDGDHSATFPHLPRGTYQVKVTAGSSIVGDHQVRLSRDITMSAPVISPVDMAIVVGSLLVVAIGLVLIGRRNVRLRVLGTFRRTMVPEVEAG